MIHYKSCWILEVQMSTRTIFIILSFGTLSGCGGSLEYKTDYQLCKALAEFPSYNIHQKARKEEVNRRGVSCSKYANRIDKELANEALASAAAPKSYSTINNTYEREIIIPDIIPDYNDKICTNGRVMTRYGCRYR
jgi:hypothetical protein